MNTRHMAALSAARLHPADRAWVLKALPPDKRELLSAGLAEVAALTQGHVDLIELALAEKTRSAPAQAAQPLSIDFADIGHFSMQDMKAILDQMPAQFALLALKHAGWPWTAAYIASLDHGRRQKLSAAGNPGQEIYSSAFVGAMMSVATAGLRRSTQSSFEKLLDETTH